MYKHALLFVFLYLVSAQARLYFPLINATIPTGYIPRDFKSMDFVQATGRFAAFGGNMTGAVVLISTETECDVKVHEAYEAGAVGAVCGTSLRVLGSSYTNFNLRTPFASSNIITVDTYSALFPNLTKLVGLPVIIDSTEGNQWLEVFTYEYLSAFVGVVIAFLSPLALAALITFILNLVKLQKKVIVHLHLAILTIATLLIIVGTIDYSGRSILFGFPASAILSNIGIQLTFTNVWLYLFTMWQAMNKSVKVTNFIRYKWLFIVLSVFTPSLDFALARASENSPSPYWSIIRLVMIGAQMFLCSAFYIVVIVRLKRFMKKRPAGENENDKKRRQRLINNCISIAIMLISRTCYAFISIVMFSSPMTVYIHMWIERAFAVYTVFVLLYPLVGSSLRELRKTASATSRTKQNTGSSNSNNTNTQRNSTTLLTSSVEMK